MAEAQQAFTGRMNATLTSRSDGAVIPWRTGGVVVSNVAGTQWADVFVYFATPLGGYRSGRRYKFIIMKCTPRVTPLMIAELGARVAEKHEPAHFILCTNAHVDRNEAIPRGVRLVSANELTMFYGWSLVERARMAACTQRWRWRGRRGLTALSQSMRSTWRSTRRSHASWRW
jgi:hypothetical protein